MPVSVRAGRGHSPEEGRAIPSLWTYVLGEYDTNKRVEVTLRFFGGWARRARGAGRTH